MEKESSSCNALRKSRAGSDEVEIDFFFNPNTDVSIKRAHSRSHFHTPPHSFSTSLLLPTTKPYRGTPRLLFERMFTNSMGYDQDRRPTKRPRDNGGESSHHPNLSINAGLAMENMGMGMGMGMGMSATGDSLKNTREGRQQQQQQQQRQQQQVSTSPTTTTGNRGRTDDKNNRKLSCKECRRRVLSFDELNHWSDVGFALLQVETQGKCDTSLEPVHFILILIFFKKIWSKSPSVIVCSRVK